MNTAGCAKYLVNGLVTAVAGRAVGILRTELDDAKHEVQEKAKGIGIGVAVIVGAATFIFFAMGVLLTAAVLGLAQVWPAWLAALVIGGTLLVIALILIAVGVAKINKNKDLKPTRAMTTLRGYFGS